MNCVKCGNALPEGNRFCMICGTPVGAPVQSQAAAPAAAPAPGPAQFQAPPVSANPDPNANPQEIPYAPPVMQGGNCIIPVGRTFRIRCPDCGHVSDDIKRDTTAGYPCPVCKKAYAYGGQLLIYRMGSFHPVIMGVPYQVIINGVEYGNLRNHSSVRIMLPAGTHTVCCGHLQTGKLTNQFQITVSPQYYNFAFKFNIIYSGPFGLPGQGYPIEFKQSAPEEIPYI